MSSQHLSCEELVEIVTEYLEGGLTDAERERFEEHVVVCSGCANYLDQIRMTIELAGRVTVDDLMEETKTELLEAFRDWKRG
ncbi:zf-HC2 domain-containing protein [Gaiella sp.]|uniref:anti-sigma factor family protein n=1 Tax=Gaiella sp. TaxID=2663207 RepID=UPI0032655633